MSLILIRTLLFYLDFEILLRILFKTSLFVFFLMSSQALRHFSQPNFFITIICWYIPKIGIRTSTSRGFLQCDIDLTLPATHFFITEICCLHNDYSLCFIQLFKSQNTKVDTYSPWTKLCQYQQELLRKTCEEETFLWAHILANIFKLLKKQWYCRLLECIGHSYGNTSNPFFLSTEIVPRASSVVPVQSLLHPHCCCWVQHCHLPLRVSHSAALCYHFLILIVCNSSRDCTCANSKTRTLITNWEHSP